MPEHTLSIRVSEKMAGVIFFRDDDDFLDRQLTRKEWDELLASDTEEFVSVDWIALKGMPREEIRNLRLNPPQ